MLRIPTPLPDEIEDLIRSTIGCAIAMHRALGPGLLETIYSRAIALELAFKGIAFEREKPYDVIYRGQLPIDKGWISSWKARSFLKSRQSSA